MIRINLLPQKRRAEKTEGSQVWLAVAMALLLVEVVGFFLWHGIKSGELSEQKRQNAQLTQQIDQTTKTVQNHQSVKKKLAELRAREDAIGKLQSARTGPTSILLELQRLLTPGRGPSVSPEKLNQLRRDNPLAVYNEGWDTRRLALDKFVEENRKVRLSGIARNGEDVSELARRMSLSSYFKDVTLLPGKKKTDKETGLELVSFELEAKVLY